MTKFAILGIQRTGTTLIRTMLNSHPRIRCAGEVFKIKSIKDLPYKGELGYTTFIDQSLSRKVRHYVSRNDLVNEYLDTLYGIGRYSAIGFKFMQNQSKKFPMVVPYLKKCNVKVIHVYRENVLKIWVSRRAAVARGYHNTRVIDNTKISISTKNLVTTLERLTRNNQHWANEFAQSENYLGVCYETFVTNKQHECERICNFLDIEYEQMSSPLKKLTSDDLSEVIHNYAEVKGCLVGTPYEILFLD